MHICVTRPRWVKFLPHSHYNRFERKLQIRQILIIPDPGCYQGSLVNIWWHIVIDGWLICRGAHDVCMVHVYCEILQMPYSAYSHLNIHNYISIIMDKHHLRMKDVQRKQFKRCFHPQPQSMLVQCSLVLSRYHNIELMINKFIHFPYDRTLFGSFNRISLVFSCHTSQGHIQINSFKAMEVGEFRI